MPEEKENNAQVSAQAEEEAIDSVNKLEAANKKFERELDKRDELLKRHSEITARERSGGKSEAGKPIKTDAELQAERDHAASDRIYHSIFSKKPQR